jgi:hypothetical protein
MRTSRARSSLSEVCSAILDSSSAWPRYSCSARRQSSFCFCPGIHGPISWQRSNARPRCKFLSGEPAQERQSVRSRSARCESLRSAQKRLRRSGASFVLETLLLHLLRSVARHRAATRCAAALRRLLGRRIASATLTRCALVGRLIGAAALTATLALTGGA